MATLAITLQGVCGGGGHLDIGVSVNAGSTRTIHVTADEIRSALDDEGREQMVASILKLYSIGKTKAQTRAGLLAGLTVVI